MQNWFLLFRLATQKAMTLIKVDCVSHVDHFEEHQLLLLASFFSKSGVKVCLNGRQFRVRQECECPNKVTLIVIKWIDNHLTWLTKSL